MGFLWSQIQKPEAMKINWSVAERMIDAYKTHPDRLKVDTPTGIKTLMQLKIEKSDLEDLIGVAIPKSSTLVDGIILFAVREEDLSKQPADQRITAILAGATNIDGVPTIDPEKLYNKFRPCPDTCSQTPVGPNPWPEI